MENMEKEIEEKEIITEEDIDESDPENKKYDESRIYYIYEHIRLDKMEPFYIGKGKGERAYDLYRNDHHDAITDEYGHAVVIIADNLTEEEAYWVERDTIEDYVFNLGYGIDIKGHNDYDHELPHLTNMDWGGIGGKSGVKQSEETRRKRSEAMKGKNKGQIPWIKGKKGIFHHTEEAKQKMSEKNKGEKNPMFGKNAFENKTKEEMEITRKKMSESHKGENNYMYGKHCSDETKRKMSEANSKKVVCITTGETFDSIKEAEKYYNVVNISKCCKCITKSAGKLQNGIRLQWKYLKDYNNEFKSILINPIIK